jgi:hypothetical protein
VAAAAAATTGAASAGSAVDQPGAMPITGVNDGGQTMAGNTGSLAIDDDDGEEDDSDAAQSLFRVAMPGVMSVDDVVRNVDLGQIMIRLVIRSRPMIRPAQVRPALSVFTFHYSIIPFGLSGLSFEHPIRMISSLSLPHIPFTQSLYPLPLRLFLSTPLLESRRDPVGLAGTRSHGRDLLAPLANKKSPPLSGCGRCCCRYHCYYLKRLSSPSLNKIK